MRCVWCHEPIVDVLLTIGTPRLRDNPIPDIGLKPGQRRSALLDERGQVIGVMVVTGTVRAESSTMAANVILVGRTIANALLKIRLSALRSSLISHGSCN
jgi:hypothetical protein